MIICELAIIELAESCKVCDGGRLAMMMENKLATLRKAKKKEEATWRQVNYKPSLFGL